MRRSTETGLVKAAALFAVGLLAWVLVKVARGR